MHEGSCLYRISGEFQSLDCSLMELAEFNASPTTKI
jgi:hypothetical protein